MAIAMELGACFETVHRRWCGGGSVPTARQLRRVEVRPEPKSSESSEGKGRPSEVPAQALSRRVVAGRETDVRVKIATLEDDGGLDRRGRRRRRSLSVVAVAVTCHGDERAALHRRLREVFGRRELALLVRVVVAAKQAALVQPFS